MKQKYAIGFITFMLATVLAACVHDYPAMTPDGEGRHRPHACRGQYRSDPRPRTPTTGNHHQQGTPRNHKKPVPENKRITAAASSSKHGATANRAARQVTVMDNADEAGNGKITPLSI